MSTDYLVRFILDEDPSHVYQVAFGSTSTTAKANEENSRVFIEDYIKDVLKRTDNPNYSIKSVTKIK